MAKLPTVEQMKFRKYPPLKSGPPILWPTNRYFRRNEGTTDYATIPTVTLAGDFVIELDLYLTDFLSAVFGNTDGTGFLRFTSATSVRFNPDVALVDFTVSAIDLNRFYRGVRLSRVSGVCKLLIGGVEYTGNDTSNESFVINRLYQKGDSFYCDGILANLKIYDDGTLVRDYPLDDNSDILANRAASLGSNLWGAANYIVANNATVTEVGETWEIQSPNGNDSQRVDGARVINFSGLIEGGVYLYTVNSSEPVNLAAYDANYNLIAASYGEPLLFTASSTNRVYVSPRTTNTVIVSNPSIRQADGYGTIINGNADDWGLFDKQASGDWLGQELVVNGGFDSTDGWTLGAGWSISDGLASHVSSSTSNLNQSANPLRESSVYLSSFSVTDVTPSVDGVRIRIGSGGNGVLRKEEGTYSEIITATNNELLFTANAFFTGSIDNVSVKEVLKNA